MHPRKLSTPQSYMSASGGSSQRYSARYQIAMRRDIDVIASLQLRIYRFWDKPVGPHPVPMFEVNVFNPHQTGTLFSWLAVNRGPLSCVFHSGNANGNGPFWTSDNLPTGSSSTQIPVTR